MRIPEFNIEMELNGHVAPTPDGDIQLLPCSITQEIERKTGISFDAFYLCYGFYRELDSIVCSYSVFGDEEPLVYLIDLSQTEYDLLDGF